MYHLSNGKWVDTAFIVAALGIFLAITLHKNAGFAIASVVSAHLCSEMEVA